MAYDSDNTEEEEEEDKRINWRILVRKWRQGIDPETVTVNELKEFVQTKVHEYILDQTSDSNLWDLFQDDFKGVTTEQFGTIPRKDQQKLRACLRCGGVFVTQNHRNLTIAQTLADVLNEEKQHEWTQEDIEEASRDLHQGPITSIYITPEHNSRPELIARIRSYTPSLQPSLHPSPRPSLHPQPIQPIHRSLTLQSVPASPTPAQEPVQVRQPTLEPAPEPTLTIQPSSGAKLISEIAKIYTDEQKYNGTNSSFDHKLTIFLDICQRVELPQTALMKAFPTMLKGLALDHFYSNQLPQRSYTEACANIRNFFEGPGYHRCNLDKWNSITLASISAGNPDKSTFENIQLLINQLRQLQYGLTPALRNVEFLHNKLVTACQGSPACRYAVSDPPADLGEFINKLQSSIITYEKEQDTNPETFYTDRRYHSRNRQDHQQGQYRGRQNTRQDTRQNTRQDTRQNTRQDTRQWNICFICKREGCRSWKHPEQEQEESKAKFRSRNLGRFNTRAPDFEKRFNKAYQQYIAEFENDSEKELEDDLGTTFDTLLAESDDNIESDNFVTTSFFASTNNQSTLSAQEIDIGTFLTKTLTNQSCTHQLLTESKGYSTKLTAVNLATDDTSRYSSDCFHGIVIDTGASKFSTAGYAQFKALQHIDSSAQLNENTKGKVTVQFGIGTTSCIGSVLVSTPVGQVEFYVMMAKTPFLLSLADMDHLGIYFNNLTDMLVTRQGNIPVVRRFGHCFLLWDTSLQNFIVESFDQETCYLTSTELQRLHRRFGHPSIARLQCVLERAGYNDIDRENLEFITKYCTHCQRYGQAPGRFKFNLRDDVEFNHSIIADIFYIQSKPVLHIVDEGTRYQAGRWLSNISAKHTWDALKACWIDTYLGPPDQITTDAGKNFASKEFRQHATTMGTKIKIVPVEAHNSIGIVERYHAPIRRAYLIITTEIKDLDRDMALQMAFKAINDSAGPDGLIPTLLVYGAYPRMTEHDAPSPTVSQRALAIRKAMTELQKLRAKKQVNSALNTRNGPNTTDVDNLALNSDVLVWREGNTGQSGLWKGPYKLIGLDRESCVLALPNGNTTFRITSVKPYFTSDNIQSEPDNITVTEPDNITVTEPDNVTVTEPDNVTVTAPIKRPRGRPRKNADMTIFLQDDIFQENLYKASRQSEILGLIEKGVFEPCTKVPTGIRIFNSRFVDEIKNKGTEKALSKSRLVVQAYNDDEKRLVLTQSPTIQRISQRIILCIAAIIGPETGLYLRDISQAYVQSTTSLNRDFYIKPPPELAQHLDISNNSVVKVVKPLYGVPEAGNHWFKTYHSHHIDKLLMQQSTFDPCLLYNTEPFGIVGLQTDDTLILATDSFAEQEQEQLNKAGFIAKKREKLTPAHDLKFNGGIIRLETNGSIKLTQERQCKNLKPVNKAATSTTSSRGTVRSKLSTKDQYIAQRARGAYIASVCQPEAAYDLSVAAQTIEPTETDVKALNKRIQWQIENAARGLRFVRLEKDSLQLLVFTDASFANNKDLSSQIGYILTIADRTGNANILHWSSIKCKRVTRSILASELYAMAHGFDIAAATKSTIDKALQIDIPLVLCTDSRSLYNCLVKLGTTTEKRLMIDVMCLRQAYERREITEVKWIKGESNPADSMTKAKPSAALKLLVESNKVQLEVEEWVERDRKATQPVYV
jgi:hypothetical protein